MIKSNNSPMKKILAFFGFITMFHIAFTQPKDSNRLAPKFDKILSEQFKVNEPGATVLVASNGKVIYQKAFGMANMELNIPMQVDNVFRIGSITKQFTAIAILQLAEQGKLDLQDEITKYIPDYPTQGNKITIEHLLTHTSGIRDFTSIRDTVQRGNLDFSPVEMINYFKNQPMRFVPGSRWEYSNSGYFLLGYIIEKITGNTYAQCIEENFFRKIGMNSSLYASDTRIVKNRADGYTVRNKVLENSSYLSMTQPYAAGSIQSTVKDLFKWYQALLSYKLVKKEMLDKAWSRQMLSDGTKTNYGYGWRLGYIQGSPSLWHGGLINGFITMAMYLPEEDVLVAVFSNCNCNSPQDITAKLAAIAIGKPYEYKTIALENSVAQEYAGLYENESGLQKIITVTGDHMNIQTGRSPKSTIKAYQKDKFFVENDLMQTLEFERNNKGKVEKLITKNRTAVEVWNKTNKPLPSEDGIKLDEKILEAYTGVYEVTPEFSFSVTKEKNRLFVEATGQEKFEVFADSETKFFLKINDAQLEFVKDNTGKVTEVIVIQGGRKTNAKKIK